MIIHYIFSEMSRVSLQSVKHENKIWNTTWTTSYLCAVFDCLLSSHLLESISIWSSIYQAHLWFSRNSKCQNSASEWRYEMVITVNLILLTLHFIFSYRQSCFSYYSILFNRLSWIEMRNWWALWARLHLHPWKV